MNGTFFTMVISFFLVGSIDAAQPGVFKRPINRINRALQTPGFISTRAASPLASAVYGSRALQSGALREIRGCIRVENIADMVPEFRILFNGKERISNSEGFYSFPFDDGSSDSNRDNYVLVITKSIKQVFEKTNTIKHMCVDSDNDYLCYTFSREEDADSSSRIQRIMLDKKHSIIPDSAIVVLVDPKYVQHVCAWNVTYDAHVVKAPVIVLKSDVGEEKLSRASTKSLLYSLDHTCFHESIKEVKNKEMSNKKISVSLTQLE